jgi:HlyD family secretion protein
VQVAPVQAGALSNGDTVVMYSAKALSADTRIKVVEQLQGAAK